MGIIYDPFLGRIRYTWSPGAGIDMSGGTISVITPPEGVPYVAGDGIGITGATIYATGDGLDGGIALVDEVMTGITGGTTAMVDVSGLRGALTAGQAVDVTSQPDGVTGDYKGTFTVTGSTLGFASFPKYASDLNYLMIADLTATTSGTVTPSGTWLDGTTAAKSLAAGTSTRVAMLFSAANKAKLTFASTGSVSVSHCREYEVTACSNEAIAYIAALSNPDAFASYYLVKADMVQPWTYIIDMGSSPAVTIASGLSYKLNAATGVHQLTVDTCPAGYDGRDAIIRITLGGSGVVQAVAPLQLGGALIPYAVNNCVVRFRDGEAVLLVEDTLAGYIVTVNTGTGEGSLPYGLAANDVPYIAFSPSTDGTPIDLSGATTAAEEVTVVGNGYSETILSGGITCTSKTTLSNLGMNGVVVSSGTLTLGDVFIPAGGTVSVSCGDLAIEKVTGNGGVIDLNGKQMYVPVGNRTVMHSVVCTGGTTGTVSVAGGFMQVTGELTATDCTFSGNVASTSKGGALFAGNASVVLSGCSFVSNTANAATNHGGGAVAVVGGSYTVSGCVFIENESPLGAGFYASAATGTVADCTFGAGQDLHIRGAQTMTFAGHNSLLATVNAGAGGGTLVLAPGAILDLTGNTNATPIAPGGGITFASGGATVLVDSGGSVASSSYMMDNVTLPAGAKLTNTAVIDLGGTNVLVSSGSTANASGCSFIGSETAARFRVDGKLTLHDATVSGNPWSFLFGDMYVNSQTAVIEMTGGCTIGKLALTKGGSATLVGSNSITGYGIVSANAGNSGTVIISTGAVLNLTGNTNATPIAPGGGIIVADGDTTASCTIINSAGSSVPLMGGTYSKIYNTGGAD